MAVAKKDGLPRKAFAYAPDANPDSWKLPLYTADGTVDTGRLPAAAAALSEGGFRGEKADIPPVAVPMVKAKVRAAYRKWKGSDAEYPASIKESVVSITEAEGGTDAVVIREATVLLDKSAVCATVISAPNGDMIVIPSYDGQFDGLAKPYESPASVDDYGQTWDIEDAARMLGNLSRLRNKESDDPAQQAMLDRAIAAVTDFLKAEASEVSESSYALIREAGRRNSAKDLKTIQALHDMSHDLGATHTEGRDYGQAMAAAAKSKPKISEASIEIDEAAASQEVEFTEASGDGHAFVLLSEAAATFDDKTRTVTITPIRPGLGNRRDGFYYPKETLREATEAGMFDNLKMYRNHPTKSADKDRPERDVNDWFATTRKATWDDTAGRPRLPIKVHSAEDYAKFKDAPEQIAFSIRGGGNAREGRAEGQDVKVIESLVKVRSVDWVTEAGAGGAIDFAESAAEEIDMDIKSLKTDQLREELRIREAAEAAVAEPEAKPKAESPAPEPKPEPTPEPAPVVSLADFDKKLEEFKAQFVADQKAAADAAEKAKGEKAEMSEAAAAAVKDEIGKTVLPKPAKDQLVAEFAEAGYGSGYGFADEAGLRTAVQKRGESLKALVAQLTGKPVMGLGAPAPVEEGEKSLPTQVQESWAGRMGEERMPDHGKFVYTAEELAGTGKLATAPAAAPETTATVSEAGAAVEAAFAARLGI